MVPGLRRDDNSKFAAAAVFDTKSSFYTPKRLFFGFTIDRGNNVFEFSLKKFDCLEPVEGPRRTHANEARSRHDDGPNIFVTWTKQK